MDGPVAQFVLESRPMNQRTARLIRQYAEATGEKPRKVKAAWAELPSGERHAQRLALAAAIVRQKQQAVGKAAGIPKAEGAKAVTPAKKSPAGKKK